MAEQPFNHFSLIGDQLHEAFSQVVRAAALNIQGGYQQGCRVDTGFQRNSAYVVTNNSSTYPGAGEKMLPMVEQPASDTEAIIAVGANYAIFNEVGTVHKPGDFAMEKAVEAERGPFQQALKSIRVKG